MVAKSPEGFRFDYEPFAAGLVWASSPGCATPDLATVGYRRVTRPLWPLVDLADWRDADWCVEPRVKTS